MVSGKPRSFCWWSPPLVSVAVSLSSTAWGSTLHRQQKGSSRKLFLLGPKVHRQLWPDKKKPKRCKYKNFEKIYSFGKIINEKSFGSATNCGPSLVSRATFQIFSKISMSKCMPVLLHGSVTLSCIGIVDANTTQTCTDLAYNIQHTLPCMPCNIIWQMPFLHADQLHKKLRGSGNSLWFSNKCL